MNNMYFLRAALNAVRRHGLKSPMLVILVGVIGGLLAHGVIGLFIGPVVLAIAWELLMSWTRQPRCDDKISAA